MNIILQAFAMAAIGYIFIQTGKKIADHRAKKKHPWMYPPVRREK